MLYRLCHLVLMEVTVVQMGKVMFNQLSNSLPSRSVLISRLVLTSRLV